MHIITSIKLTYLDILDEALESIEKNEPSTTCGKYKTYLKQHNPFFFGNRVRYQYRFNYRLFHPTCMLVTDYDFFFRLIQSNMSLKIELFTLQTDHQI